MPTLRLLPELEDALRHLPGVKAASVVTGPDAVPGFFVVTPLRLEGGAGEAAQAGGA